MSEDAEKLKALLSTLADVLSPDPAAQRRAKLKMVRKVCEDAAAAVIQFTAFVYRIPHKVSELTERAREQHGNWLADQVEILADGNDDTAPVTEELRDFVLEFRNRIEPIAQELYDNDPIRQAYEAQKLAEES
jgi:hypothetical protein